MFQNKEKIYVYATIYITRSLMQILVAVLIGMVQTFLWEVEGESDKHRSFFYRLTLRNDVLTDF